MKHISNFSKHKMGDNLIFSVGSERTFFSPEQIKKFQESVLVTNIETDTVLVSQVFGLLGVSTMATKSYNAALLELFNSEFLAKARAKLSKGQAIRGIKFREGVNIPRPSALTEEALENLTEIDTGILPFVQSINGTFEQQILPRKMVRIDDFDVRTATTSITAGTKLDSVRNKMRRSANNDSERIERLEAGLDELIGAVEKINNTLRLFRDAFNSNVEALRITEDAVSVLQYNMKVLHDDVKALYETDD